MNASGLCMRWQTFILKRSNRVPLHFVIYIVCLGHYYQRCWLYLRKVRFFRTCIGNELFLLSFCSNWMFAVFRYAFEYSKNNFNLSNVNLMTEFYCWHKSVVVWKVFHRAPIMICDENEISNESVILVREQ